MNVEELLRDTFREQAEDGPRTPPGFADRVLAVRRRRRTRTIAGAAVATVAAIAVVVAVPRLDAGGEDVRPAGRVDRSDISAQTDQYPPRDRIAAGDVALAAYSVQSLEKQPDKDQVLTRTYHRLDQRTGRYVKDTRWSVMDTVPSSRTAVVLEHRLPAQRVGLLDLTTGEIRRWIPVPQGVGGVALSPDGKKIVATTYASDPDRRYWNHRIPTSGPDGEKGWWLRGVPCRTGFSFIDVASGHIAWHRAPDWKDQWGRSEGGRWDFRFSADSTLIYEHIVTQAHRQYHDLSGKEVATPANEVKFELELAGYSPDKKFLVHPSGVRDMTTGKEVPKVSDYMARLAWADNKRLIVFENSRQGNHPHRLALMTLGSSKVVPLTAYGPQMMTELGSWEPLFSAR
ncbi:WD40 repeat domain-containing protein [Streptomyces sp. NPDC005281]|uniref:WD40 repeat domain-containing protein n=1 Tax=Streptomyces sp. NPDC005281 TaxID=3155712 RepID=UPI0033AB75A6